MQHKTKKTRTKNLSISNSNQFLVQRSKNQPSTNLKVLQKLVFGYTAQLTGNLDDHNFDAWDYNTHVKNFIGFYDHKFFTTSTSLSNITNFYAIKHKRKYSYVPIISVTGQRNQHDPSCDPWPSEWPTSSRWLVTGRHSTSTRCRLTSPVSRSLATANREGSCNKVKVIKSQDPNIIQHNNITWSGINLLNNFFKNFSSFKKHIQKRFHNYN